MRTGNGRHRRPRQASAIFVTAGVTSAGIAMPLLGATGAQAADAGTWDRVAQCETGGAWSENSGNGFYGGLQITQESWEEFGGRAYAPRADLASRSQQIAVAEKVLAEQGMDAWSRCGAKAGLAEDGDRADVDPGLVDLDLDLGDALGDPSGGNGDADSGGSSDTDSRADSGSRSGRDDDSASGSAREGTDSESAGGDHGSGRQGGEESRTGGASESGESAPSGRHRGEPAPEEAGSGSTGSDDRTSRGASRGGQQDRGDYTVRTGDSLSAIAAAHDLDGGWTALYDANRDRLGPDPDLIHPGEHLDFEGLR